MYRNHSDVIAFKDFARLEIEILSPNTANEERPIEKNYLVLRSLDFEKRLLLRQAHVLNLMVIEESSFFYSFSEYLDGLRTQLKNEYLTRLTNPGN